MAFEDVPTWYIRNKGVSEKYNGVSGKTCADAVWEKYEWTHQKSPQGVEYPLGWTSYLAKSCLDGNWTRGSTTTELYCQETSGASGKSLSGIGGRNRNRRDRI